MFGWVFCERLEYVVPAWAGWGYITVSHVDGDGLKRVKVLQYGCAKSCCCK